MTKALHMLHARPLNMFMLHILCVLISVEYEIVIIGIK